MVDKSLGAGYDKKMNMYLMIGCTYTIKNNTNNTVHTTDVGVVHYLYMGRGGLSTQKNRLLPISCFSACGVFSFSDEIGLTIFSNMWSTDKYLTILWICSYKVNCSSKIWVLHHMLVFRCIPSSNTAVCYSLHRVSNACSGKTWSNYLICLT